MYFGAQVDRPRFLIAMESAFMPCNERNLLHLQQFPAIFILASDVQFQLRRSRHIRDVRVLFVVYVVYLRGIARASE